MSESRKYVFFILLFQFFKTRIRSVPMISCAVAKIFWGLLINRLSGEVSFLLADKRNSILFNMYCFSFSWAEHFILSKLTFIALPNVHANMCYLVQTDRAHLGAPIVFGQWNLSTSKNLKNCIYFGELRKRKALYPRGPRTESKFSHSFLLLEEEIYKVGTERECWCIYLSASFGLKWIQMQQCIFSLSFEVILGK